MTRPLWFSCAVLSVVVSGGVAHAATLTLAPVRGIPDMPQAGVFTLDPSSSDGRTPIAYRCAQTFFDLPLAEWTALVSSAPVSFTRLLPGYQMAADQIVSCDVAYSTGPQSRVSAVEELARRAGPSELPESFLRPAPGVLFHLLNDDTTGYGAWPVVQYNDQGRSLMRYAAGNNFVPLEWSYDEGYAWSSEFTRGVDKGEPRWNTVIAAHVYARWLSPSDVFDFTSSSTALLVELAGDRLDLKGGGVYFAVLIALPDGRHARYHLRRPLAVRNGAWSESGWYVPSANSPDWWCSFASNGVPCSAMPAGPDLRYIDAIEILITDGALAPTGVLKIRNLQVWQ